MTLRSRRPAMRARSSARRLAQNNDANIRVRLAQSLRGLDSLVCFAGGHPDVGYDDVRLLGVDGGEQRAEVLTDSHDLELGTRLEQPANAFADKVVILREHQPDRHEQGLAMTSRLQARSCSSSTTTSGT